MGTFFMHVKSKPGLPDPA